MKSNDMRDKVELVVNGFKITSYKRRRLKNNMIESKILYLNWSDMEKIVVEEDEKENATSILLITRLGKKYLIYPPKLGKVTLDQAIKHIIKHKDKNFKVIFFDVINYMIKQSY